MLPASNRGVGMNLCFPDVCNTPTPAGPVPIPYPNIARNAQALGFSPCVKVSMMNALNLGSTIPMTTGDEAGSAGPIKGPGRWSMGNPIVKVDKMPAINLTSLATGNSGNAAIGAAIVPSAVNVVYTKLPSQVAPSEDDPYRRAATVEEVRAMAVAESVSVERDDARLTFRVAHFGPDVSGKIFAALEREGGVDAVVVDVRGCPGGELEAFFSSAELFLPKGALLASVVDEDGDVIDRESRGGAWLDVPLTVLVDGATASAAELFAGALSAHGRARVLGSRTFGKSAAQRVRTTLAGEAVLATSLRVLLPGHVDLEGRGVSPEGPVEDR